MDEHQYSSDVVLALKIEFSGAEKEVIRFCARHFAEKATWVAFQDLPHYGQPGLSEALDRLIQFRLLESVASNAVEVLPACVELVHTWDNPPPEPLPDYRDKLSKWFWSKPWSLAAYLLVVGLPALLGYVVMAKTILAWTGVIEGSK